MRLLLVTGDLLELGVDLMLIVAMAAILLILASFGLRRVLV
ncbi:MAG: hypothetical protein PHF74_06995 [Dehalococcoidales bacterium]|nr:hypothetical protein [Dehalococcoidales bacterium]